MTTWEKIVFTIAPIKNKIKLIKGGSKSKMTQLFFNMNNSEQLQIAGHDGEIKRSNV
jgi:hypothetical protein